MFSSGGAGADVYVLICALTRGKFFDGHAHFGYLYLSTGSVASVLVIEVSEGGPASSLATTIIMHASLHR